MGRQRYFFVAVISAILLVLAILAGILLFEGDDTSSGEGSTPDDRSAPSMVELAGCPVTEGRATVI